MKIIYISSTMDGIHNKSIYSDLVNTFKEHGHQLYVMYAREKRTKLTTETYMKNGINYLGVKTGNITKNKNFIEKGISTLMIDYQFKSALKKYWSDIDFDLVLFSTPPITMERTLRLIKKSSKNPTLYLMLKDIFPQNAIDLNIIRKNGVPASYFRYKENKLYRLFDVIGVMSQANKDYILKNHPYLNGKVEVFPNTLKPRKFDTKVSRDKFSVPEDKVCLFYGGNLGKPQGIPFLIRTMEAVKNHPNINFYIAGSGAEDYKIREFIEQEKPKNIRFFGPLPNDEFHDLIRIMDICLIYLDYRFTIPNYPQRILAYMEAGKPIICASDSTTDIGIDAEKNNYGIYVPSNDVNSWVTAVEHLSKNKKLRKQMGSNALHYFLNNFTSEISYRIIMKHFEEE